MSNERKDKLEDALIIAHAALRSIAENPMCPTNHIKAGTAQHCIEDLHDEVIKNNILIAG